MINIKEDKELNVLNHSCAHLMAQAVKHLYPNALFWVGPVIEEGFYYDVDLGDKVLGEEDLEKIYSFIKLIYTNKYMILLVHTKSEYEPDDILKRINMMK